MSPFTEEQANAFKKLTEKRLNSGPGKKEKYQKEFLEVCKNLGINNPDDAWNLTELIKARRGNREYSTFLRYFYFTQISLNVNWAVRPQEIKKALLKWDSEIGRSISSRAVHHAFNKISQSDLATISEELLGKNYAIQVRTTRASSRRQIRINLMGRGGKLSLIKENPMEIHARIILEGLAAESSTANILNFIHEEGPLTNKNLNNYRPGFRLTHFYNKCIKQLPNKKYTLTPWAQEFMGLVGESLKDPELWNEWQDTYWVPIYRVKRKVESKS